MYKKVNIIGFLVLITLSFIGCKKEAIDAIPDHCFELENAFFRVNEELQPMGETTLGGVNVDIFFGAKGNGEWGLTFQNDDYLISITMSAFISNENYNNLSKQEWLNKLEQHGNANLKTTPLLSQLFFQDLSNELLFQKDDIVSGNALITFQENGNCALLTVNFVLEFEVNDEAVKVDGEFTVPTPPKL